MGILLEQQPTEISLDQLAEVRKQIIRKEGEIESVAERLEDITDLNGDDAHKARTKLRHERQRLLDLKCRQVELEVQLAWNGIRV